VVLLGYRCSCRRGPAVDGRVLTGAVGVRRAVGAAGLSMPRGLMLLEMTLRRVLLPGCLLSWAANAAGVPGDAAGRRLHGDALWEVGC
jgi:hypothetical protein